jgi:hypothetical protein
MLQIPDSIFLPRKILLGYRLHGTVKRLSALSFLASVDSLYRFYGKRVREVLSRLALDEKQLQICSGNLEKN